MKKRSKRIGKVVDIAESEERQQCRAVGKSQRNLDDEVNRLEELKAYRQSYMQRPAPHNGISKIRWQDYQLFLRRLDQAVSAQEQLVKDGERNRDAHRRRWMVKKQRLDSLERVVERYRKADDAEIERELQRTMDELPTSKGRFHDK